MLPYGLYITNVISPAEISDLDEIFHRIFGVLAHVHVGEKIRTAGVALSCIIEKVGYERLEDNFCQIVFEMFCGRHCFQSNLFEYTRPLVQVELRKPTEKSNPSSNTQHASIYRWSQTEVSGELREYTREALDGKRISLRNGTVAGETIMEGPTG